LRNEREHSRKSVLNAVIALLGYLRSCLTQDF